MRQEQILNILPVHIRWKVKEMRLDFKHLQEIRVRVGKYIIFCYGEKELILNEEKRFQIKEEHLKEILEYISQYSLYTYEQELKQGYLTIEGGHRIGLAGKVILEHGKIKTLKYITSMNIRVAHEVVGCSNKIMPYVREGIVYHTLIISPPRCGKTTLLRDLIRVLSDGIEEIQGLTVGVVDERSELGACYRGIPQNNLGTRTDILDGCPKGEGMMMLVRSMSPQVIVVDEIGIEEDIYAINYVIRCGCKIIASIHGTSLEDVRRKPVMQELIEKQVFERYIVLGNNPEIGSIQGVYDGNGRILYENSR